MSSVISSSASENFTSATPTALNVLILAAGQGKRMQSNLPKVLQPLAGQTLLAHVLRTARQLQPATLTVVIGHGAQQIQNAFQENPPHWALQNEQLGTGHAVQQAAPFLDERYPTLVLYGDVPLTQVSTLRDLVSAAGPQELGILTMHLPDPSGYGRIVRDAAGRVQRIVEHKDADATQRLIHEINTGILVCPTRFLKNALAQLTNNNAQREYYLTDVVALAALQEISITTAHPTHAWEVEGVNSKAQLAALERVQQHELAQQLLAQGVSLADPQRLDIRGTLQCGRDVFIDVNCVFEGEVSLGDGVQIGANTVLRNAHLANDVQVHPFSHIDGGAQPISIGAHASIGPFARLRPGTQLAEQTHVGNFVEIKNSSVGSGSKINHLSYVGDASVGAQVNIGAGTITCNYDGVNKHRTVIEDGAFIGSGTQLVAPVLVGKNATLGAGTTLTKNAPAEKLTLSRARQTMLEGWKRPVKKN